MARLDRATLFGTVVSRPTTVLIPIVAARLEMTDYDDVVPDRVARSSRALTVKGNATLRHDLNLMRTWSSRAMTVAADPS